MNHLDPDNVPPPEDECHHHPGWRYRVIATGEIGCLQCDTERKAGPVDPTPSAIASSQAYADAVEAARLSYLRAHPHVAAPVFPTTRRRA